MDYRGRSPSTVSADASLADDLNSFYARFEGTVAEMSSIARDEHTCSVTPAQREEGSDVGEHQESCRS